MTIVFFGKPPSFFNGVTAIKLAVKTTIDICKNISTPFSYHPARLRSLFQEHYSFMTCRSRSLDDVSVKMALYLVIQFLAFLYFTTANLLPSTFDVGLTR